MANSSPRYLLVPFSRPRLPSPTWATASHLGDGHPVPVVDPRGCGTLRERVVTGVGEVMAVSISTVAVRKGFCKRRRRQWRWQAPWPWVEKREASYVMRTCIWAASILQTGRNILLPSTLSEASRSSGSLTSYQPPWKVWKYPQIWLGRHCFEVISAVIFFFYKTLESLTTIFCTTIFCTATLCILPQSVYLQSCDTPQILRQLPSN